MIHFPVIVGMSTGMNTSISYYERKRNPKTNNEEEFRDFQTILEAEIAKLKLK